MVRLGIEKWCFNPHKKKKPEVNKDLIWEEEDMKLIKSKKVPEKNQKKESKLDREVTKKLAKDIPKKEEVKELSKE